MKRSGRRCRDGSAHHAIVVHAARTGPQGGRSVLQQAQLRLGDRSFSRSTRCRPSSACTNCSSSTSARMSTSPRPPSSGRARRGPAARTSKPCAVVEHADPAGVVVDGDVDLVLLVLAGVLHHVRARLGQRQHDLLDRRPRPRRGARAPAAAARAPAARCCASLGRRTLNEMSMAGLSPRHRVPTLDRTERRDEGAGACCSTWSGRRSPAARRSPYGVSSISSTAPRLDAAVEASSPPRPARAGRRPDAHHVPRLLRRPRRCSRLARKADGRRRRAARASPRGPTARSG